MKQCARRMRHERSQGCEALIAGNGAETTVKKIITMIVCLAMISLVALILLPLMMGFKFK